MHADTAPPPWTLHGRAVIALYGKHAEAALGALMLVRYKDSPVGPYDELLWATAPNPSPVGPRPQVHNIVVSTEASVRWGRHNWGIPKGLARFEWQQEGQTTQVRIHAPEGHLLAHLAYRTRGISLPVSTIPVPAQFRTLAQPALDGKTGWLLTPVNAVGTAQSARLTVLDAAGFHAPLMQLRPLLTLAVQELRLVFPVPERVDGVALE
ncbi:acetoacetate decarboxylase family protein [Deinococcus sp. QL22]|uniref:acetoacetate decarboxylase family protein n=1 Tax=Deinococcus sp. QL22 TaxID=2939437 RepID=UPI00201820F0|nr:acetoacetate decarboxylase family protein [Deinococcus sp. QL22]UQN06903.1 acetoacetate decarboxylase family protein [Deinococcus sp. QL22]